MNKKKVIILSLTFGVLLTSYIAYKAIKKRQYKTKYDITDSNDIFPLKYGSGLDGDSSEIAAVKVVQKYLNDNIKMPLNPIDEDGKFGRKTEYLLMQLFNRSQISKTDYELIKQNKSL